jgi:hypothetical protein
MCLAPPANAHLGRQAGVGVHFRGGTPTVSDWRLVRWPVPSGGRSRQVAGPVGEVIGFLDRGTSKRGQYRKMQPETSLRYWLMPQERWMAT